MGTWFHSHCFAHAFFFFFEQYAEYGATAKVEHMEKNFNLLSFSKPLTGISISRGGTSAQLQPHSAATGKHKKLEFDVSEGFSVASGLSGGSSLFGKTSFSHQSSTLSTSHETRAFSHSSDKSGVS